MSKVTFVPAMVSVYGFGLAGRRQATAAASRRRAARGQCGVLITDVGLHSVAIVAVVRATQPPRSGATVVTVPVMRQHSGGAGDGEVADADREGRRLAGAPMDSNACWCTSDRRARWRCCRRCRTSAGSRARRPAGARHCPGRVIVHLGPPRLMLGDSAGRHIGVHPTGCHHPGADETSAKSVGCCRTSLVSPPSPSPQPAARASPAAQRQTSVADSRRCTRLHGPTWRPS